MTTEKEMTPTSECAICGHDPCEYQYPPPDDHDDIALLASLALYWPSTPPDTTQTGTPKNDHNNATY